MAIGSGQRRSFGARPSPASRTTFPRCPTGCEVGSLVVHARTEIAFFDVPLPQSGNMVAYLRGVPSVSSAAAVYSGVDVIAILDGAETELDLAYARLEADGAPIASVDRFVASEVLPGLSHSSRQILGRSACLGFVRATIREPDVTVTYAAEVLMGLPGVVRVFPSADKGEIALEVVADGKRALDEIVMSHIQGAAAVVKATRTYVVINSMRWDRGEADDEPLVFISVAKGDAPFALALRARIEKDCAVRCWTFHDIPVGAKSWSDVIDDVIARAACHIFVTSKEALASAECQREFVSADAISVPTDICCLLVPECTAGELPAPYRQRQCLKANDFFAYPHLLDWLLGRAG